MPFYIVTAVDSIRLAWCLTCWSEYCTKAKKRMARVPEQGKKHLTPKYFLDPIQRVS